jgi:hypothetical protein
MSVSSRGGTSKIALPEVGLVIETVLLELSVISTQAEALPRLVELVAGHPFADANPLQLITQIAASMLVRKYLDLIETFSIVAPP